MDLSATAEAATSADPLEQLRAVVSLRRLCDQLEASAVQGALMSGVTWSCVADALGVTRQAVHKKHRNRIR